MKTRLALLNSSVQLEAFGQGTAFICQDRLDDSANPASGVLETSTNLAPNSWSPAGSPTQQPDGSWRLDVASNDPMRFYRLRGN
jgi:hypothetical protein